MKVLVPFVLLVCLTPAGSVAQAALRVGDARVEVQRVNGHAGAAGSALSSFGAQVRFEGWSARLVIFGDTLHFAPGSPFFSVRGRLYQLVAPAVRDGSELWLPLHFFTAWLPARYPRELAYANGALTARNQVVATTPPAAPAAPQPPPRPARIVILDAGHGGRDPGKPGPNGVLEKSAALAIVSKLAGFLRERGYEVHLTRSSDTLVALADRPHLANQWKNNRPGAVFVSVHANSGTAAARGFETYFLSEARTEDERRVAEMENAAVRFETPAQQRAPELDLIVSGLKNDFYQRASNDLAGLVQQNLALVHPGPNRGVKQAGFRVLVGALMPAVLIETAFISNLEEARLLGTAAFQEKIAWSIAAALDRFFETHQQAFAVPTEPGR